MSDYDVDNPDNQLHALLAQTGHRIVSAEVVAAIRDIFDAEQDEAMPNTVAELVYKHYDLVRSWLNVSPPSSGPQGRDEVRETVARAIFQVNADRAPGPFISFDQIKEKHDGFYWKAADAAIDAVLYGPERHDSTPP